MNTPLTDEEREAAALLGQLKVAPSAAARARAFAKLQAEFQAQRAPAPTRRYVRWAFAAGIAMAITAAWLVRDANRTELVARVEAVTGSAEVRDRGFAKPAQPLVDGGEIAAGNTLVTGDAGGALLRVTPDLTVRLAAATQARFTAGDELELLRGQAFIDATPGAQAPLRVVTPYGTVTHLGTQYLVKLGSDGVEVAVREGRTQFAFGSQKSVTEAGHWVLHRGPNTAPLDGALEPADPRFEWVGTLPSEFHLEGATLAGFLAWFQRETGLTPIYSPGLDAGQFALVQLKGSIDDLEPLEALSYVLATADLAWHREGAKVIIEQRQAATG